MTTTIQQSPVEPSFVLVNASGDCFFFVILTNQSWTNQNQHWWVRSWFSQQLRTSPTVLQHDFQEPDTARCCDLSGPIPTRARDLRRPDTARCPGCSDPTTHRARDLCRSTRVHPYFGMGTATYSSNRDFFIVSSAARLRIGLVIVAARLGRIISARTLLRTAVTRDFSIVSSAARFWLGLVILPHDSGASFQHGPCYTQQ